jgi:16S rRNA (uracil1498-N3)-methyltransferase
MKDLTKKSPSKPMALPYFYAPELGSSGTEMVLDESTSKHCIQVLRMRTGDALALTNGRGLQAEARILSPDKKHCPVQLTNHQQTPRSGPSVTLGISPLKNTSRFEWFLEKATEIGINRILPLICERTEKEQFRLNRLTNILVSAMLQSMQTWIPELGMPQPLEKVLDAEKTTQPTGSAGARHFIAHCMEGEKQGLREVYDPVLPSVLLIGPEGDFSPSELEAALNMHWKPVSLGNTRLRTETAAVAGAVLLRLG